MFSRNSRLNRFGSTKSAVPAQLFETTSTGRVFDRARLAWAAGTATSAAASTTASASLMLPRCIVADRNRRATGRAPLGVADERTDGRDQDAAHRDLHERAREADAQVSPPHPGDDHELGGDHRVGDRE